MTQPEQTIGARLHAWRIGRNLPAYVIANKLLISHMQLGYIENDQTNMSADLAATIEALIAAPAEEPPSAVEDALIALIRTAAQSGWEIVIRRPSAADDRVLAVIEEATQ